MFPVAGRLDVLPEDPRRMLELLTEVVSAWRGGLGEPKGCTPEELVAAEDLIGTRIPDPLRSFLALYGHREDLMGFQDPLLLPGGMWMEGGDVLVFQEENQKCALWGISIEALNELDPPVLCKNVNDGDGDWLPYQDRLSVHLLETALNELMTSSGNSMFREADAEAVRVLSASLTRIGIPEHVFWAEPEGSVVKWLASADFLVRVDGDSMIWASAPLGQEVQGVLDVVSSGWERADI
ncbi:hypothetical protein ABT404_01210 [Streptomyces hyaluromycini]|uniref:Knr4/Smi1-like domain-containing protein n=1 Tax=Streptomyces hyaluromycini TaxID=1377993 RepID=A0ABV1WP85_9ACTN